MTTITKEEVKAFIEQIESDLSNGWEAQIFELKLARIALASLEAEKGADPVVFTDERNLHRIAMGRETSLILGKQNQEVGDIPLYRQAQPVQVDKEFIPKNLDKALGVVGVALPESKEEFNFQIERWIQRLIDRVIRYADEFKEQPAPVVPDEMATSDDMNLYQKSFAQGYNACRAAMLQAGNFRENKDSSTNNFRETSETSTNSPVIPDGLSTVCAEAYQVVGVMADALGVFGDAAVQKVLDNLSQQKLVHRDVLPFSLPVTPDGWISCSERIPAQDDWVLIYSKHGEYMAGQVQGEYVELSDGTLSWLGNVLFWMPLPEPPQGVNDELA